MLVGGPPGCKKWFFQGRAAPARTEKVVPSTGRCKKGAFYDHPVNHVFRQAGPGYPEGWGKGAGGLGQRRGAPKKNYYTLAAEDPKQPF